MVRERAGKKLSKSPSVGAKTAKKAEEGPRAFFIDMDEEPKTTGEKIEKAVEESLESVMKSGIEPSQADLAYWEQAQKKWTSLGALEPMYPKDLLCRTAEKSGPLQESISVYVRVIEGYGHTFENVLDVDQEAARDQVKWSLWSRQMEEADEGQDVMEPTEEEVDLELARIKRESNFQRMKAKRFFDNAARHEGKPISFIELRQKLRTDLEIMGECYVEVLREEAEASEEQGVKENEDGAKYREERPVRRLQYLPSVMIRMFGLSGEKIKVLVKERVDSFTIEEVSEYREFRRYVQVDPYRASRVTYFKEFGDPRVMSPKTGAYYSTVEELKKAEGSDIREANEVIRWALHHPMSTYGVPRWSSNSPSVIGGRKAEEVNANYFDNKTIPPYIVLVSGGRLGDDAESKIKRHLKGLKGSDNFHKILVLEAMPFNAGIPGTTPHRTQIEVKSLFDRQQQDALFLNYQEYGDERISANYRTPPILRGRSQEYTRATASAALAFFEEMVSQPERRLFDDPLSQLLLELGITLVRYKSKGPETTDIGALTELLDVLLEHGVLVPSDARVDAEKLLGRELGALTQDWSKVPQKIYIAKLEQQAQQGTTPDTSQEATETALQDENATSPSLDIPSGTILPQRVVSTLTESDAVKSERAKRVNNFRERLKQASLKSDLFGPNRSDAWTGVSS